MPFKYHIKRFTKIYQSNIHQLILKLYHVKILLQKYYVLLSFYEVI